MRFFKLFLSLVLFCSLSLYAQEKPSYSYQELVLQAEQDFSHAQEARKLAVKNGEPISLYTPGGIFIEALGVENGKAVYAVTKNIHHPFQGGTTAFYGEISSSYDLEGARVHYGGGRVENPELGFNITQNPNPSEAVSYLLVPESTGDVVMLIDPVNGDLLNATYIVDGGVNLSTPIQARLSPWGNITVSDQVKDGVIEYDTLGNFLQFFAPAGGVNTSILDNVRGHNFSPSGTMVVTTASGANSDAIAEFDQSGNYLGNFIEPNAAIMDSPFDIIFRDSDVLVTASSSNAVHRYDLTGNFLDDLVPSISFPEQVCEFSNGDIGVAGFSTPSGVYVYSSTGTQLSFFTGITGNRGVYKLGNGNILTTNGSGVHVLDGTTGALISTPASGVSGRFISEYDLAVVPVELVSFNYQLVDNNVRLTWETATETNNAGFAVERGTDGNQFREIAFVEGNGTTTQKSYYSYVDDVRAGLYYYRLKQTDYDGSFEYSNTIEVNLELPVEYSLYQNYPNPFNPSTTIKFSIPVDARVNISVFNSLGEEVAQLVNEDYSSGIHQFDFNASALASGLYIYSIKANGIDGTNFNMTRKMILLK